MSAAKLLLVDDDDLLRRSLTFNLEQAGYAVMASGTAEDALAIARREPPDLVLLDIGLPGMDGLDALRVFQDKIGSPVIFLTARRRELDEVLGLELGAEDYITKPFDQDVLLARIKAILRRTQAPVHPLTESEPVEIGDIYINPAAHTLTVDGKDIDLPPREFDLLHTLALEAGNVISTDDLLARVWGAEYVGEPQVVYVHIRWLREKIEDDPHSPKRILTVRGVGYKLQTRED
ncbi:MAG: response regulator transcription factor [Anaerolineales bacterium]|jgi:DNA-binding response OmpR family regulator